MGETQTVQPTGITKCPWGHLTEAIKSTFCHPPSVMGRKLVKKASRTLKAVKIVTRLPVSFPAQVSSTQETGWTEHQHVVWRAFYRSLTVFNILLMKWMSNLIGRRPCTYNTKIFTAASIFSESTVQFCQSQVMGLPDVPGCCHESQRSVWYPGKYRKSGLNLPIWHINS